MGEYRPTATDLPTEGMLKFMDKIVTIHRIGEHEDSLCITVIKNPDGTYGYRKIELDPKCNKLTEIIVQNDIE